MDEPEFFSGLNHSFQALGGQAVDRGQLDRGGSLFHQVPQHPVIVAIDFGSLGP